MSWSILIPDRLSPPADVEAAALGEDAKFDLPVAGDGATISDAMWRRADAVLAWHEVRLHAGVIEKLDRCKVIVRVGAGFDNVDLEAAGRRGIPVCNVPDYGTNDVADHAMSLYLGLARGIIGYDRAARSGAWSWDCAGALRRVTGSSLGIVGLGRIGTAVAMRAKAFGLHVLFYDPYKAVGYDKALGIERVFRLDDLLTQSDAVTLHTPLTEETRHLAGKDFFRGLKEGAIFINTARGACCDLEALHEALRSNRLRGAGLDVLEQEPPDPRHPLIQAWRLQEEWIDGRLLITPHAAFYNRESYAELRRKAAEEACRVLTGATPRSCVNGEFLKRGDSR
jgi:lactate dehydrogenase-like 2-hydroxyacid dehydrogenase